MAISKIELTEEEVAQLPVMVQPIMQNNRLPQEPYPGFAVKHPSCSQPTKDNKGCDAFNRCETPMEGPYDVVFRNKRGVVTSCHCRHWMFRFRFDRRNMPVNQNYIIGSEGIKDPVTGEVKIKYFKMEIMRAKNPYGNYRTEDTRPESGQPILGDKGYRKGHTGPKGHDAASE